MSTTYFVGISETTLFALFGALFVLIGGSYAFTWQVYQAVVTLRGNHVSHLQDDVRALQARVKELETRGE